MHRQKPNLNSNNQAHRQKPSGEQEDLYLNLSSILLRGGFVVIINTVLTLPGALISHGCAGGDKIDTAGPSSLQLVIVPITLPVIFSAYYPLDPVPINAVLSGPCLQPTEEPMC